MRLVDEFWHPKKKLDSQTYRIVYRCAALPAALTHPACLLTQPPRDMEKTLTQAEANSIHARIEQLAVTTLGVTVR